MAVYYDKGKDSYYVSNYGKSHYKYYSCRKFGIYAKYLAEMTDETGEFYKNYFVIQDDITILKTYTKQNGYHDVYIDSENFEKIKKYRWRVHKGPHNNSYYCTGSGDTKEMKLHRFILNYTGDELVDHIDGNGLNNLKSNLRIVSYSVNGKNQKRRKKKSKRLLYTNVYYDNKKDKGTIYAQWYENKKLTIKSFSVNKYGYGPALKLAIGASIKGRQENDYILTEQDLDYLNNPRYSLHLRKKKDRSM